MSLTPQLQPDGDEDMRVAKSWIDHHNDTWDPHKLPAVCQGRCPADGRPTAVRVQLPGTGEGVFRREFSLFLCLRHERRGTIVLLGRSHTPAVYLFHFI